MKDKKKNKQEQDEVSEKQLEDVAGGIIEIDHAETNVSKKTTEPLDKPVPGSGGEDR